MPKDSFSFGSLKNENRDEPGATVIAWQVPILEPASRHACEKKMPEDVTKAARAMAWRLAQ